ncbi:hypothetical protein [Streptomyces sp. AN091965]|uniref:hypothetical protein n=1 Tax=Streptomyces sp. AN091965 TaxID=2927803 RepID=UPI001F6233CE|nr:hypothetical protein [Streptomyces sp. AN091965]MCI3935104.1 hypothetical protein [Streptomyces sp. AN091965]
MQLTTERVAAALLLIALSAATGCSSGSDAGSGAGAGAEPEVKSTPTVLAAASLKLPLDAYQLSSDEFDRLAAAQSTLVARCMHRFGFAFRMPDPPPQPEPPDGNERRYGTTDRAAAAKYGYQPKPPPPGKAPASKPAPTSDDPAETSVLLGKGQRSWKGKPIPEKGCAGEAARGLSSGAPPLSDSESSTAQNLSAESFTRSQRDSRVRAVLTQWARCMKAHGYDYATPLDPPGDPRFTARVTAQQIETANADITCKKKTNLVGVWFAVESRYQKDLVTENRTTLEKLRRNNQAQLAEAARVTGRTTPR